MSDPDAPGPVVVDRAPLEQLATEKQKKVEESDVCM